MATDKYLILLVLSVEGVPRSQRTISMPLPPRLWTWLYLYSSPTGLFSRYRKVFGTPLGRLVRKTVRFRARVASLPRWLAPKITISSLLRSKAPSGDPSFALCLYPSRKPSKSLRYPHHPRVSFGTNFNPVFLAFSCKNTPRLPAPPPASK